MTPTEIDPSVLTKTDPPRLRDVVFSWQIGSSPDDFTTLTAFARLTPERIVAGDPVSGESRGRESRIQEVSDGQAAVCGLRLLVRAAARRYCSERACQRTRGWRWQRQKLKTDADYRANQAAAQQRWRERHRDYWRLYRRRRFDYSFASY